MTTPNSISLLRQLTEAHGAPSTEAPIRAIIRDHLSTPTRVDGSGNIFCELSGDESAPRVIIEAHMDEVGFMVQAITKDGFLRVVPLGGWWSHTLPAHRVRVRTRAGEEILGVIAVKPIHMLANNERENVIPLESMVIDIGASNAAEVADFGVALGDTIVPDTHFAQMRNPDLLIAKAFDNRVGVAVGIEAFRQLSDTSHPNSLCFVGAVQEELGTRGARVAMHSAEPDVAIVLEGPPADDLLGATRNECQGVLGGGVQLRLMDPSAVMNRPLADFVQHVATENNIPLQVAVRRSGGTDAAPIHLHRTGVPTVVLGVPARYIHTHNSIINLNDYSAAIRLLVALGQQLDAATVATFTNFP